MLTEAVIPSIAAKGLQALGYPPWGSGMEPLLPLPEKWGIFYCGTLGGATFWAWTRNPRQLNG
jgi:hypothetical protein